MNLKEFNIKKILLITFLVLTTTHICLAKEINPEKRTRIIKNANMIEAKLIDYRQKIESADKISAFQKEQLVKKVNEKIEKVKNVELRITNSNDSDTLKKSVIELKGVIKNTKEGLKKISIKSQPGLLERLGQKYLSPELKVLRSSL